MNEDNIQGFVTTADVDFTLALSHAAEHHLQGENMLEWSRLENDTDKCHAFADHVVGQFHERFRGRMDNLPHQELKEYFSPWVDTLCQSMRGVQTLIKTGLIPPTHHAIKYSAQTIINDVANQMREAL